MKWLGGPILASLLGAFLVVRIVESVSGGAQGAVVSAVKASLFVATWTAITTGSGMHDVSKRVRQLREKTMSLGRRLDTR